MDAPSLVRLLLSGRGRIGHTAYFFGIAMSLVVMFGPLVLMFGALRQASPHAVFAMGSTFIFLGAYMILALVVKRVHDTNSAGTGAVVVLAILLLGNNIAPAFSVVLLVALVIFGVVPGTRGANRYGEPPTGLLSIGVVPTVKVSGSAKSIAHDDRALNEEPPPVGTKLYEHGGRRVVVYPDGNVRARNQLGWHAFPSLDAYLEFVGENARSWAKNARPIYA